MSKGQNQKAKLLHLARILNSQTDQEHPMSIARMMELLQAQGVDVKDRKSLYDDLETLRTFGMVMTVDGGAAGFRADLVELITELRHLICTVFIPCDDLVNRIDHHSLIVLFLEPLDQ